MSSPSDTALCHKLQASLSDRKLYERLKGAVEATQRAMELRSEYCTNVLEQRIAEVLRKRTSGQGKTPDLFPKALTSVTEQEMTEGRFDALVIVVDEAVGAAPFVRGLCAAWAPGMFPSVAQHSFLVVSGTGGESLAFSSDVFTSHPDAVRYIRLHEFPKEDQNDLSLTCALRYGVPNGIVAYAWKVPVLAAVMRLPRGCDLLMEALSGYKPQHLCTSASEARNVGAYLL